MKPYVPDALPIRNLDIARLISRIGPANAALARYDGLLQSVINPGVMLSPLTEREAVLSSKIEGTQATVDEVWEYEAGVEFDSEKTRDIKEVVNYRQALRKASRAIEQGAIDLLLIRQMHGVLMDSVRGSDKSPGQFRTEQNWIGTEGSTIETAKFVPPSPESLPEHLKAFEQYLAESDIDPLVQTAVMHAQFEILHPFKDGNGRIGRLLIPLFLFQKRVLTGPMFYLSEYLETHRELYYARLRAISDQGDWTGWIEFFLEAIRQQAIANSERVRSMHQLYERMKTQIQQSTRSPSALAILDALFDRPIFEASEFAERIQTSKATASELLRKLRATEILAELRGASGRQPAILVFPELLQLVESPPDFTPQPG